MSRGDRYAGQSSVRERERQARAEANRLDVTSADERSAISGSRRGPHFNFRLRHNDRGEETDERDRSCGRQQARH